MKKIVSLFLLSAMVLSTYIPLNAAAQAQPLAHWVFSDDAAYSSGALSDNTLRILDKTGRGNDLLLMPQRLAGGQFADSSLSFNDSVLTGKNGALGTTARSIDFSKSSANGAYFATTPGELDTEEFMDGYTLEIIFSAKDTGTWAAVLGKRGTPNSAYTMRTAVPGLEPNNGGSFNIGGGNDYTSAGNGAVTGDLQLVINNTNVKAHENQDETSNYQSTMWSDPYGVTRDRMHYAVIRNDGRHTALYIDGLPVLRSDNRNDQPGIDMLDGLGWAIGANYSYSGATLTADEFKAREAAGQLGSTNFRGELQEIRITKGYLDDSELLIPDNAGLTPDAVYTDKLGNNDDTALLSKEANYTLAFIPDTQYYVQYKRGTEGDSLILSTMLEWIGQNRDTYNIIGAASVGDVTENNNAARSETEWDAASKSYDLLDEANVPYTVLPGNHDWRANFLKTFPESRSADKGYEFVTSVTPIADSVTGETVAGLGFSRYMVVKGGSYTYLILATGTPNSGGSSLNSTTGDQGKELAWAQAVLRAHPDMPTIVMEHMSGGTVINNLVRPFPQVFMHVWGHLSGSYANWITPEDSLNPGYWDIQIDYQSDVYGGNGWLDLFEFDESAGEIKVHTYSPWVERKLTESAADSEWWQNLPFADRKIYAHDVKNLTRYNVDSSSLIGYRNSQTEGRGLITANKPSGRTDGVLPFDFETRLAAYAAQPAIGVPVFTDETGAAFDDNNSQSFVTTLHYKNETASAVPRMMVVALYDKDGKMVDLNEDAKMVDPSATEAFEVALDTNGSFAENGYTANIFLWDGSTYAPVLEKMQYPPTLRVASFNIATARQSNEQAIADQILAFDVDIVGMQEIDMFIPRHDYDQLARFKNEAYPYVEFGCALGTALNGYGVGTVSSIELAQPTTTMLINEEGREQRVYQRSVINVGGKEVAFYNTHLDHQGAPLREAQARELKAAMDADPLDYIIATGDFNMGMQEWTDWHVFSDNYTAINGKDGNWLMTYMSRSVPDNILVSKNIEITNVAVEDNDLSDHDMFYADLVLTAE